MRTMNSAASIVGTPCISPESRDDAAVLIKVAYDELAILMAKRGDPLLHLGIHILQENSDTAAGKRRQAAP